MKSFTARLSSIAVLFLAGALQPLWAPEIVFQDVLISSYQTGGVSRVTVSIGLLQKPGNDGSADQVALQADMSACSRVSGQIKQYSTYDASSPYPLPGEQVKSLKLVKSIPVSLQAGQVQTSTFDALLGDIQDSDLIVYTVEDGTGAPTCPLFASATIYDRDGRLVAIQQSMPILHVLGTLGANLE